MIVKTSLTTHIKFANLPIILHTYNVYKNLLYKLYYPVSVYGLWNYGDERNVMRKHKTILGVSFVTQTKSNQNENQTVRLFYIGEHVKYRRIVKKLSSNKIEYGKR